MKHYILESGGTKLNGKEQGIDIKLNEISPMNFISSDFWLAVILLICGFLYWEFIKMSKLGAGVTSFAVILCSITLIYFRVKGIKQSKRSIMWLVLTQVLAFQFLLFDGAFVKFLNLVFISGSFIYWVAISTKRCIDSRLSIYLIGDILNQSLLIPFTNITCEYFGLKYGMSKNKHSKNIIYVLAGVIIFLPLMMFVVVQLSLADAAFENILDKIMQAISVGSILVNIMQFIIGIPVACYLFGLIYGNTVGRNINGLNKDKILKFCQDISFAPRITIYTVMLIFNIIYIIFFLSQITYFLSAFENVLPSTFTYAEYARRGFFELCKVSMVNMFILTVVNIFIVKKSDDKNPKMLRLQTAVMSIMTIGLIITALRKMYMYIQVYGLTQLRVYTSWFMIILLLYFGIIFIRQIKKFNASRIIIVGGIIGFMILSYGNIDGNIAKYNIENYQNGNLKRLDYDLLVELSDAAVPHIYELYKSTDDLDKKEWLYNHIVYDYGEIEDYNEQVEGYEDCEENDSYYKEENKSNCFIEFNLQSSKANSIRGLLQSEGYKYNPKS